MLILLSFLLVASIRRLLAAHDYLLEYFPYHAVRLPLWQQLKRRRNGEVRSSAFQDDLFSVGGTADRSQFTHVQ